MLLLSKTIYQKNYILFRMKLRIEIFSEIVDIEYSSLEEKIIIEEKIIGDTYFITTDSFQFSCYKENWEIFKRDRNINFLLS